jgi:hypothetical protein
MILIVTAQPEQQRNVERAAKLGLHHRVVPWNEGSTKEQFVKDFTEAYRSLIQKKRDCPATREFEAPSHNALRRRLDLWVDILMAWASENGGRTRVAP